MMKMKESPGNKAHRFLAESDYAEKLRKGAKKLWQNSIFQKELRAVIRKRLLPRKKGYSAHYSRKWLDFCDRWNIEYFSFRSGVKKADELFFRGSIRVGRRWSEGKESVFMEPVPGKVSTQRDKIDHIPLLHHLEGELSGSPTLGRPSMLDDYKALRAEYKKRRLRRECSDNIIDDMAKRKNLSFERMRYIVKSKKYD